MSLLMLFTRMRKLKFGKKKDAKTYKASCKIIRMSMIQL